ncbi:MAG: hypothetical protein ABIF85_05430 [Nanoarchaeota archaeon]|nr:hypothetical protein [Nanoarchaeota archaeon]MBU4299781.1 hypothetical protein [Nanoarchaeota archaeon]MBU4452091.1 hypothetical protein [Nanoarchaeota archaeon]MCG2723165.1 hypothetical protein [archaeon]
MQISKSFIERLIFFDRIRILLCSAAILATWLAVPLLGDKSPQFTTFTLLLAFFYYPSLEMMTIETYVEWSLGISIGGGALWLYVLFIIDILLMYLLSKKITTSKVALTIRYWHFLITLPLVIIWWLIPQGDAHQILSRYITLRNPDELLLGITYLIEAYASLIYTGYLFKKIREEK